jgi:squalene-hopene/tetraprenyl-beta-curcumene cyclase
LIRTSGAVAATAALAVGCIAGCARAAANVPASWNAASAASYLDRRADWWMTWRVAARDHGTFCVSCHTTLPYALSSPVLRERAGDTTISARAAALLDNVRTRVHRWAEVSPYYGAHDRQSAKAAESRATEAVINAVILATADATAGRLSDDARVAFDHMWALQRTDGADSGAWLWLQFHLEPWEGAYGEYYGAVLAAVAIGTAPERYASTPGIQSHLERLRAYLDREFAAQPLSNRAALLRASATMPQLLGEERRARIVADLRDAQQRDGGWSLERLSGRARWWDPRRLAWPSDGYATGLAVLALDAASGSVDPAATRGLTWLATHQRADGSWEGHSLNSLEPVSPGVAQFMSDASTAYAVLALGDAGPHIR